MKTPKNGHMPGGIVLQSAKGEKPISASTKEKAESIKAYIQNKYSQLTQDEKAKKEAWEKLKIEMEKANLSPAEQELIKREILHREAMINREGRAKIFIRDFIPLSIIGKGAFGEVRLVKTKKSDEVLALKKMKKSEMISKHQINHVKAEKEVLSRAHNSWIVELKYSFQDEKYLYLAMEYLPGGDLMNLLIKKEILSEEDSRFYIAEIIMAVETVHTMNYIHRDLKPDNILITRNGHIKLSDFGLCKYAQIKSTGTEIPRKKEEGFQNFTKMHEADKRKLFNAQRRQLAFSTVGTPDYIAPEVFGQAGYNEAVDWWSVGVIFYEMVVGYPPFFSDDPSITCQKIIHWKKTLIIPSDANLSPAATDLIKSLICDLDRRLGSKGIEDIKNHAYFEGLDWERLHEAKSPFIPELSSNIDTKHFDKFEEDKNDPFYPPEEKPTKRIDMYFPGYTYKADVDLEKKSLFQNVANGLAMISEAQKLNETKKPSEASEDKISKKPRTENRPPNISKNMMQGPKIMLKDKAGPSFPLSPSSMNAACSPHQFKAGLGNTQLKFPSKAQIAFSKPSSKPGYGRENYQNLIGRDHSVLGSDKSGADSKEKRTITPTRKLK